MSFSRNIYNVALNRFAVEADANCKTWQELQWHYTPFADDREEDLATTIRIDLGKPDLESLKNAEPVLIEDRQFDFQILLHVYRQPDGSLVTILLPPDCDKQVCSITVSKDCDKAVVTIDESDEAIASWILVSALTSCIQLAYLFATLSRHTLLSHAASVLHDGKAYLFIAKSGTGKSTHARLWMKNIADCILLNDDHPVIRVIDGNAIAFGSPWSGKTHCYKKLQAPIGAIVRISRADHNSIERLSPIKAYASLMSSFSCLTCDRRFADFKHRNLEEIINLVPCFTLSCLPDDEAALVCHKAVTNG